VAKAATGTEEVSPSELVAKAMKKESRNFGYHVEKNEFTFIM